MVLTLLCLAAIAAPPLDAAEKPGLIVVITIDQMRTDYLVRFRPYFGKDGFNRFLERGAQFPENRHRHAITFTGPGHASIGTGLDPRDHGIIGNRWYDVQSGPRSTARRTRGAHGSAPDRKRRRSPGSPPLRFR
jgi:predicted AlkP superfamily pyrophosphatase or phosphodiesterase